MIFLMWFDDSKLAVDQKIQDGIEAFQRRFHSSPNLVCLNDQTAKTMEDSPLYQIEGKTNIPLNTFWVGHTK